MASWTGALSIFFFILGLILLIVGIAWYYQTPSDGTASNWVWIFIGLGILFLVAAIGFGIAYFSQ